MKSKKEDIRVNDEILDNVCLDCCDFNHPPIIDCEICPVDRLKENYKEVHNERV